MKTEADLKLGSVSRITVMVEFDWIPPEPDVGVTGGVDVLRVFLDDDDITDDLQEWHIEQLATDIAEDY